MPITSGSFNDEVKDESRYRYWKIGPDGVFETETRQEIYEVVMEEPGKLATDYARFVDVDRTTVEYHLDVLEYFGYVRSEREVRDRWYVVDRHGGADL